MHTHRQTDRKTDISTSKAASSQLKKENMQTNWKLFKSSIIILVFTTVKVKALVLSLSLISSFCQLWLYLYFRQCAFFSPNYLFSWWTTRKNGTSLTSSTSVWDQVTLWKKHKLKGLKLDLKLQFWLTSSELSWMALSIQSIITSCFCLVFNFNPIIIQKWLRTKNLTNSWR